MLPHAEEDEESKDKIFNQKANAEEDEERRHLPDSWQGRSNFATFLRQEISAPLDLLQLRLKVGNIRPTTFMSPFSIPFVNKTMTINGLLYQWIIYCCKFSFGVYFYNKKELLSLKKATWWKKEIQKIANYENLLFLCAPSWKVCLCK